MLMELVQDPTVVDTAEESASAESLSEGQGIKKEWGTAQEGKGVFPSKTTWGKSILAERES